MSHALYNIEKVKCHMLYITYDNVKHHLIYIILEGQREVYHECISFMNVNVIHLSFYLTHEVKGHSIYMACANVSHTIR